MKAVPTRLFVYPKDIQRITGKGEKYGRKLLRQIRTDLKIQDHQPVSFLQLANYFGLTLDEIKEIIVD